jgi:protein gp37
MGDKSGISWTDATWNPLVGCSRVSEGCRNCYAEREAAGRLAKTPKYQGLAREVNGHPSWTGELRLWEPHLDQPLRWRAPRRIFVNSMSDLFHEKVPDEWIDRIFAVMCKARQHTYQVLTKRPKRMRAYMDAHWPTVCGVRPGEPPHHIWLGVSVEDQATADERIPLLLQTPAAVRWVSYEPALVAVDFSRWLFAAGEDGEPAPRNRPGLDWIVVGGESGPSARPFDLSWARSTVAYCRHAGVAVFVKQLGARPFERDACAEAVADSEGHRMLLGLRDRKGGDPSEWPQDLRVREYPK